MKIYFQVPGPPQGKARARTFYNERLGRVQSITPEKTVLYENLIKLKYQEAARGFFFEGPVLVVITAVFAPPASTSKKKRAQMLAGDLRPTKKPDLDNICKCILDGLNNVAYKDDSAVVGAMIQKVYGVTDMVKVELISWGPNEGFGGDDVEQ